MATANIPSTSLPVGLTSFGPFTLVGVSRASLLLTPTVWPSSGIIGTLSLIFDDGTRADFQNIPGAAIGSYRGGGPIFNFEHRGYSGSANRQTVSVQIQLQQAITVSGVLTYS